MARQAQRDRAARIGGHMTRQVELLERARLHDGFFKLDEVRFRHELRDGTMSAEMSRLLFERGDSVAVLLYDRARDAVLLVEQFRYPAYARGEEGWLLEVVAGILEAATPALQIAHRELLEETGYRAERLAHLQTFYVSPGACTERIHLYVGHLDEGQQVGPGGGLPREHEDIRLIKLTLPEALRMIATGEIRDAKTIIALQWLALHKLQGALQEPPA